MTDPPRRLYAIATLAALGAVACATTPFHPPTATALPAVRAPPQPPAATPGSPGASGRTETVVTPGARPGRSAVLAVGPVALDGASLGHALLQRLLARHVVRVADMTRLDALSATVAQSQGGDAVTFQGPLMALAWGARLGSATHLLLTESLQTEQGVTASAPLRVDAEALARYAAEREQAIAACAADRQRVDRELERLAREFADAERLWRSARPPISLTPDDSFEQGQAAYRSAVDALQSRRAQCDGLDARLPTPEALRTRTDASPESAGRRIVRATGQFRVVSLPGAALLWTATLAREGADAPAAVGALLDALAEALPFGRRANERDDDPPAETSSETREPGAPTTPTETRRHRHRPHGASHEGGV